jgi:hypothetical protein
MAPRWSVGIVIPACDEATLIGACLASVVAARVPEGVERWIVVVADRCSDRTAALAGTALAGARCGPRAPAGSGRRGAWGPRRSWRASPAAAAGRSGSGC